MTPEETKRLPIYDRKWYLNRWVKQKEREKEEMESTRRNNKR